MDVKKGSLVFGKGILQRQLNNQFTFPIVISKKNRFYQFYWKFKFLNLVQLQNYK